MAAIDDLISQIQDAELRDRIQKEVNKLSKQKKFGLVFEDHLPECTPLFDMPIRRGCNVMLRDNKEDKSIYVVMKMEADKAICTKRDNQEELFTFSIPDIVRVAEFGESIYPYLKPLDSVCNAPESDLWHTLIEADNYHALQLLEYLYAGKVDCIYIDPPYNTGAKDWKYNNDYVDGADTYRHSKWLSMMEKRLKLAKKLLNPKDSVLLITIDEKEYLHLGCLLEELFPEARMQMISTVINSSGSSRATEFARANEYIFVLNIGDSIPNALPLEDAWLGNIKKSSTKRVRWDGLIRTGSGSMRGDSPSLFYPIFVSKDGKHFKGVGEVVPLGKSRQTAIVPSDCFAVWPIRSDGSEGRWRYSRESLLDIQKKGYVKLGGFTRESMAISYISSGWQEKVENGEIPVLGINEDGSLILDDGDYIQNYVPNNQWAIPSHNATEFGTKLLQNIIGKRFSYPKSLYAVHDVIRFFTANKPSALIVDFFAGSGTTLHAVNLLNAEDGGKRRCIMVTNNEVSVDEASTLLEKGFRPGDKEWNELGIARHVTWPRTVCSIVGQDITGKPLKGNYYGSELAMSSGFKTNAVFFQLGFLDKTAVSLGMQFKELLPTLWMKTGAVGECPNIETDCVPSMLILPKNKFAVLTNENAFAAFSEELVQHPEIQTVFLATDYEVNYRSMVKNLNVENSYHLYRDYLDHFRLNRGRN